MGSGHREGISHLVLVRAGQVSQKGPVDNFLEDSSRESKSYSSSRNCEQSFTRRSTNPVEVGCYIRYDAGASLHPKMHQLDSTFNAHSMEKIDAIPVIFSKKK
jgi:hypothetical protein